MTTSLLRLLAIGAIVCVTGCASPAVEMTPQQISQLTDQQICNLHNGFTWETKTELEIGRRNLNCDPDFNLCVARGIDPRNTPVITSCMQDIQDKRAMQKVIDDQRWQLEQNRYDHGQYKRK